MFYIGFTTGARTDSEGWRHALGGIELGSGSESFAADLSAWSPHDYEAQWREGIARLAGGQSASALITSYGGPNAAVHSMWPMWRVGRDIVFHEQLLPGDVVREPAVAACFYDAVGDRRSQADDGEPISEWRVPFADVLAFLATE